MSASLSTLLFSFFRPFLTLLLTAAAPRPATLTVAAAADLAPAQNDLVAAFQRSRPAVKVQFVIGASAILAQQIENQAPFDVFLSADKHWIDELVAKGRVLPASVRVYATGQLAMLCRSEPCADLQDLLRPDLRFLAIANPKLAPYGNAAASALRNAGLWEAISPRIVYGENVRQTLQLFDSGNADAVITAASLVAGRRFTLLAPRFYQPLRQSAGIVSQSTNAAGARAFLDFLTSAEGVQVLCRFGFGKP